METLKSWTESILPWIMTHGIRIVFIVIIAFLLNRLLSRIIIRAIRISVKVDENTSPEGERSGRTP
ncbi:MAG: hypothetical protein MZV63_35715 [Marinilabiliales bacterium]|nr:hypothetical protein [Marinilabiliales bacterium]